MTKTSHSYFVVMVNHGKSGLEAIVHPEDTRRKIIDMIASGEFEHIVFIHHVDGLYVEDVTDELVDEAETATVSEGLAQLAERDHARDLRKHEVA